MSADSTAPRLSPMSSKFEKVSLGRSVVLDEALALQGLSARIPAAFDEAVDLVCECRGAVIVIGIGKAGWVAQKLSATLASTGTRSHFLHPAEAIHGDLGRIGPDDLVVLLSNSGETEEISRILPTLERMQVKRVAITSKSTSTLARQVDCVLDYGSVEEACPLGLAPSTSTTVMMALGDALALVVSRCKGFEADDFGEFHPGGSLGRRLANVEEVMRPYEECRIANASETVREIYIRLSGPHRRSGAVILVDDSSQLVGIFTDSDLARLLEWKKDSDLDLPIERVMTRAPVTIQKGTRVQEAINLLSDRNLSELPVVDQANQPVGMIDVTDLLSLVPAK